MSGLVDKDGSPIGDDGHKFGRLNVEGVTLTSSRPTVESDSRLLINYERDRITPQSAEAPE